MEVCTAMCTHTVRTYIHKYVGRLLHQSLKSFRSREHTETMGGRGGGGGINRIPPGKTYGSLPIQMYVRTYYMCVTTILKYTVINMEAQPGL